MTQHLQVMVNAQFIGEVRLRNGRKVYFDERRRCFIVKMEPRRRGEAYETEVLPENVEILKKAFRSQEVSVGQVLDAVARGEVRGLSLRTNDYGYKRQYELQDILIVLAALGDAQVSKQGREYIYDIKG